MEHCSLQVGNIEIKINGKEIPTELLNVLNKDGKNKMDRMRFQIKMC